MSEDQREYEVVINDEEQYSIWLRGRALPPGWHIVPIPAEWLASKRAAGAEPVEPHAKSVCLDYIGEIWVDMRPLSLRRAMAQNAADARE